MFRSRYVSLSKSFFVQLPVTNDTANQIVWGFLLCSMNLLSQIQTCELFLSSWPRESKGVGSVAYQGNVLQDDR